MFNPSQFLMLMNRNAFIPSERALHSKCLFEKSKSTVKANHFGANTLKSQEFGPHMTKKWCAAYFSNRLLDDLFTEDNRTCRSRL